MITNNVIDGNTDGKRNSLLNGIAVDLFVVQLADLCLQDGRAELT